MNIPKEVRLRTVVILLSSLLVLSSVSIYYAFSASTPTSGLTDIYIEPPMMESSYSIGIYTSPSTCYLKNGTDGDIETTGTFYACLYAATEALTTGGKILIRSGYYNQTLPITITHDGIYIEGEGQGLGYDYGVQIEWGYTAGAMFYYGDPATTHHFYGGLKGISFIGNSLTNTYAVSIQSYFSDLTFEDCGFFSFDSSVVIQGYGTSGETKNWNFFFSRCDFETNLNAGIYFTNTNDLTLRHVDRVKISECHFYGNKNSILCDTQYVFHVTFTDNTVQAEKQACINVTSGGRQWIITDNHIFDCGIGANGTMAAIMVNGTATWYPDSWLIENNIIANHFTSAPVATNNSVWLTGTVRNFAIQGNFFYVASEAVRLSGLSFTIDPILVIQNNVGDNNTRADNTFCDSLVGYDGANYYAINSTRNSVMYLSSDAALTIQYALTNSYLTYLKFGTYPLGTSFLNFTLGNSYVRSLIADPGTILTGNGTKMIDVTNLGYGSFAANSERMTLENVEFYHNTQRSTDITLDLIAAQPNIKNIKIINSNTTKQGVGLLCGKGNASAPTGQPISWENIFIYKYSNACVIGVDHLTVTNLQAFQPLNYGITIADTYNPSTYTPEWITLYNPEVNAQTVHATIYPYYFYKPGKGIQIYGAKMEGTTVLTNPIFYYNLTNAYKPITVFGFDGYPAGCTLCNAYSRVVVDSPYGTSLNYPTSRSSNTASCINGTAIEHTLCDTPTSITLTMYGQNYINSTCWYLPPTLLSMNSTHFILCFTIFNAGTITPVAAPDSRTIYWIVTMSL